MSEQGVRSSDLCPHPPWQVQSGIYAKGVYVGAVCMACGAELTNTVEIIVTEERDDG